MLPGSPRPPAGVEAGVEAGVTGVIGVIGVIAGDSTGSRSVFTVKSAAEGGPGGVAASAAAGGGGGGGGGSDSTLAAISAGIGVPLRWLSIRAWSCGVCVDGAKGVTRSAWLLRTIND